MKFQTPYYRHKVKGENFTLPSLTVPDQTLSIPEILRRYSRGLSLGGMRTPIYEGEDDLFDGVDPRTLDLSELHEIAQAGQKAASQIEDIQKKERRRKEYEQMKEEFRNDDIIADDAAALNPARENSPAASDKKEGGEK